MAQENFRSVSRSVNKFSIGSPSFWMERALFLAEKGIAAAQPNPSVGCVIVYKNQIIGEGHTQAYGGAHAEVVAFTEVEKAYKNKQKEILAQSTVFVTLEPCSHTGKTPPCVNLFLENPPKKVFISTLDPNPLVGGKGIERLKNAGLDVEVGLLEKQSLWQNRRFFTNLKFKRPYLLLKWAQTKDGFVARENYDSKWISNKASRSLVHKYRAIESGILVGASTVQYDDPHLGVRLWHGQHPIRVILDPNKRLPDDLQVWDGSIPTFRIIIDQSFEEGQSALVKEIKSNLKDVYLPKQNFLDRLLSFLYEQKIGSLMVEGGAYTLQQFLDRGLWDECRVFCSNQDFGQGIPAPSMNRLPHDKVSIENDLLYTYFR